MSNHQHHSQIEKYEIYTRSLNNASESFILAEIFFKNASNFVLILEIRKFKEFFVSLGSTWNLSTIFGGTKISVVQRSGVINEMRVPYETFNSGYK